MSARGEATATLAARSKWSGPRALEVALRCFAAIVGGYIAAALWAAALARLLPLERSEAVTAGALTSLVVCSCVALYAFAARSLGRLFRTLALAILALGAAIAFSFFLERAP